MPSFTSDKRTYVLRASTADGSSNITGATQKNGKSYKGVKLAINISAFTGSSVTFTLEGLDPISGTAYTLLASAAKSGTGAFTLTLYPGVTETANVDQSDVLPIWWRIKTTGTYTVCTWSVYAELIP